MSISRSFGTQVDPIIYLNEGGNGLGL